MKYFVFMAASSVFVLSIIGCGGSYGPMDGRWDYMMNYGYGFGGMFMWILFIIVMGIVAYLIIQGTRAKTSGGMLQETPLDILKKRYAKGEVSKEDFERMKHDLEV